MPCSNAPEADSQCGCRHKGGAAPGEDVAWSVETGDDPADAGAAGIGHLGCPECRHGDAPGRAYLHSARVEQVTVVVITVLSVLNGRLGVKNVDPM